MVVVAGAAITRRRTDLAVRVGSRADKYSALAGDAVEPSGGASITTVYRLAADPAASRSVHCYRYVKTLRVPNYPKQCMVATCKDVHNSRCKSPNRFARHAGVRDCRALGRYMYTFMDQT